MDPTNAKRGRISILGDVPGTISPHLFEKDDPSPPPNDQEALPVSEQKVQQLREKAAKPALQHKKVKSTAEQLFDLSWNLDVMQQKEDEPPSAPGGAFTGSQDAPVANWEGLAKNAASLARRHESSILVEEPTDDPEQPLMTDPQPSRSSGAPDRMRRLLARAQSTRHLMDGNDDDEDEEEEKQRFDWPNSHKARSTVSRTSNAATTKVKARYKDFEEWLVMDQMSFRTFVKIALLYVIIPGTALASLLYYGFDNPPCGYTVCKLPPQTNTNSSFVLVVASASVSWWLMFLLARQVVTLSLAIGTQAFLVDYLAIRTKLIVKAFSPLISLFVIQSKGWPLTLIFWGFYDFLLLYGRHHFAEHW